MHLPKISFGGQWGQTSDLGPWPPLRTAPGPMSAVSYTLVGALDIGTKDLIKFKWGLTPTECEIYL